MKAPICRFKDPNNPREHSTHYYPFATLSPLVSHIKPQYVVANAAQKLGKIPLSQLPQLQLLLQQVSSHRKKHIAAARLHLILDLYDHWTTLVIPDDFATGGNGLDDEDHPPSDRASSSAGDAEQSDDDRETNDSGELSTPSKSKQEQQYHDDAESTSSEPSMEDTIIEGYDWNPSEETAWLGEICDWAENCRHAAASKGWESGVLNDDQVAAYAKEPPHSTPLPESWHKWQPRWDRCEGQCPPFNTENFSSNDWAIYEEHTYLAGTIF